MIRTTKKSLFLICVVFVLKHQKLEILITKIYSSFLSWFSSNWRQRHCILSHFFTNPTSVNLFSFCVCWSL